MCLRLELISISSFCKRVTPPPLVYAITRESLRRWRRSLLICLMEQKAQIQMRSIHYSWTQKMLSTWWKTKKLTAMPKFDHSKVHTLLDTKGKNEVAAAPLLFSGASHIAVNLQLNLYRLRLCLLSLCFWLLTCFLSVFSNMHAFFWSFTSMPDYWLVFWAMRLLIFS